MKDNTSSKLLNKPIKTIRKEPEDTNIDKSLEDKNSLLEELKGELVRKDGELTQLKEKLSNTQERLLNINQEKKLLEQRKTNLELKEIELKLNNLQELENKHDKLTHRNQVTKKQLDQARTHLKIQENIIRDLKNRGLLDYLLRRFPESFQEYQKE
jgi:chromosome segregation ATPase